VLVVESLIEELKGSAGNAETRNRCSKGCYVKESCEECILKVNYEVALN